MRAELPGSPEYEAAKAKGLDMSQAGRMARAKEMGFDTGKVFYHGTDADIYRFNASGRGTFGEGVYLTGNPKLASGYATQEGGNVLPVYVKGKIATEADIDPDIPAYGGGSDKAYDAYSKGFSGYLHKYSDGTEELIVFDPSNIRSVHAAFDPDKTASPILTAGLGGGGRKPPPDSPEAITEAVRGIARQTPATPADAPLVPPRGNMRGVLQAPERIPPASPMAGQVQPPLPPRPVSNRAPTSNMPTTTEMGLMAGTGMAVGGAFLMEKANDPATFGLASFDELPPDHPLRDPQYRQMALMAQMQPPQAPRNAFAQ
jgi:hypothetical protein